MKKVCGVTIILFALLLVLAGCRLTDNTTGREQAEVEDSVDASSTPSLGRNLLKVSEKITLAFEEPERTWQIVKVVQDSEKNGFVALVRIVDVNNPDQNTNSKLQLQFFDADGSFQTEIMTQVYARKNWNSYVQLKNGRCRIESITQPDIPEGVLYCDQYSGEVAAVPGRLLSTDSGYDLVGRYDIESDHFFHLVYDMDIVGTVKLEVDRYFEEEYACTVHHVAKTAELSSKHIRYTLDFTTGRYVCDRIYSADDLDRLIAETEDGTLEIYEACPIEKGDTIMFQIVTRNKNTGEIQYLTEIDHFSSCFLVPNNRLFINSLTGFRILDIRTGQPTENTFEELKKELESGALLLGAVYDPKGERYVFACRMGRDFPEKDEKRTVRAMIYDKNGRFIKNVDSGLKTYNFYEFDIQFIKIKTNDDGSYTFTTVQGNESAVINPRNY